MERLRWLIILVDRAPVGTAELDSVGNDSGEHCVQVEGRVDRLADFPQGLQLFDRLHQFARARLQLLEQADVLDGDHRLVSKCLEQCELAVGERSSLGSRH